MAKRPAKPKRRLKHIKSPRQDRRKRSKPKADQLHHAAYSPKALEPENINVLGEKAPDLLREGPPQDVLSLSIELAQQLIAGALNNPQTFPFTPPLVNSSMMRNGTQAITRELLDYWVQQNDLALQFFQALPTARSPPDLFIAQSNLAKKTLESMFRVSSRISQIAMQMAKDAGRKRDGRPE
jgi:hypothetical protein